MTRTIPSLFLALVAGAAACGGAEAPARSGTTAQTTAATPRATCVATLERQRACGDLYLPALVEARIANDLPAGIAARAAEPGGRDAIMVTARAEWANDSTDASIGASCDNALAQLAPEQAEGMAGQANQCLAADACQAFVDCVIPMTVSMWQSARNQ